MALRLDAKSHIHNWNFVALLVAATMMVDHSAAFARPTNPNAMFSFSITDEITFWETADGSVRVHYSAQGPNQTRMQDDDGNGVPDFVEEVAAIAQESLNLVNDLNFLLPLREYEIGVVEDGGSDAYDFYLVDFGGNADGHFGIDACNTKNQCTGHMVIENDFTGYAYSSYREGLETVIPHELFHFVQAAYNAELPIWISEGTAVWVQKQFDTGSRDFRGFVNAYLADTGRPLNKPPSGPVPAFAYGTAIWWEFLTLRHGTNLIPEFLLNWETLTDDAAFVDAMVESLEDKGDTMEAAWMEFSSYNLATGNRAGSVDSYPDAALYGGIQPAEDGSNSSLETSNRFYPLTTNYYLLEHAGGPLHWAMAKESSNLRFSFFPAASAVGEVQPSLDQWASDVSQPYALQGGESFPAGSYWLGVMNPTTSGNSVYTDICLGTETLAQSCRPEEETGPGTSEPEEDSESGCQQASHPPLWLLLMGLFFWNRSSRNSRNVQTY